MTGKEVAEIIGQLAILVTAIASLVASIRNAKKIEQVHLATNSMKDELVAATKVASKIEGIQQEKQDEQSRQDLITSALASSVLDGPREVKIVNPPHEPVPTILTEERETHKLPPKKP